MAEHSSVIVLYGSKNGSSAAQIMEQIDNNDYLELRCVDILSLKLSAEVVASNLVNMCLEHEDLVVDFENRHAEGVLVLRVAPNVGKHVALIELAELLKEVYANRE